MQWLHLESLQRWPTWSWSPCLLSWREGVGRLKWELALCKTFCQWSEKVLMITALIWTWQLVVLIFEFESGFVLVFKQWSKGGFPDPDPKERQPYSLSHWWRPVFYFLWGSGVCYNDQDHPQDHHHRHLILSLADGLSLMGPVFLWPFSRLSSFHSHSATDGVLFLIFCGRDLVSTITSIAVLKIFLLITIKIFIEIVIIDIFKIDFRSFSSTSGWHWRGRHAMGGSGGHVFTKYVKWIWKKEKMKK